MTQEITIEAYLEALESKEIKPHWCYGGGAIDQAVAIALGLIIAGYDSLWTPFSNGSARKPLYESALKVHEEIIIEDRHRAALRALFEVFGHTGVCSNYTYIGLFPEEKNYRLVTSVLQFFHTMKAMKEKPITMNNCNSNHSLQLDMGLKLQMSGLENWWPYGIVDLIWEIVDK